MKKLRIKIKKWFIKTFLEKYFADIHMGFFNLITMRIDNIKRIKTSYEKRYNDIIKILTSKKYQDYFYTAVNYHRNNVEPKIKPFGKSLPDRIKKFVAKAYIYLFDKKLHDAVKRFNSMKIRIGKMNNEIDEYMATITIDERTNRAKEIGIITKERGDAQKRLRKIQSSRVSKILVNNLEQ